MSKKEEFITYYKNNIEQKVFLKKLFDDINNCFIMYNYDYTLELENFSDSFLYYFPFYVLNDDRLSSIDAIDEKKLKQVSVATWKNSSIVPMRDTKINGIFGELFLDFYLRIVRKQKCLVTYAAKRSFGSDAESHGIDNTTFFIDDGKVNICFCEAKFVNTYRAATDNLIHDIVGDNNDGHLSSSYLNNYISFITDECGSIPAEDKRIIQNIIDTLNRKLNDGEANLIECLVQLNIKINFIFFAIFRSDKKKPIDLKEQYKSLNNKAEEAIKKLNVTDYSVEIVFIPTDNESMVIKKRIEANYD